MSEILSVLLIGQAEENTLKTLLRDIPTLHITAEVQSGTEALYKLAIITPDLIVLDDDCVKLKDGASSVERMSRQYPSVPVVVISSSEDAEHVRQYMRSGARDYLSLALNAAEMLVALQTVVESERNRSARSAVAGLSERTTQMCRVMAFMSAKGGVGKTTIAVNIASALAGQGKRVLFIDFDLQFGDASLFLNIEPRRTLVEMVQETPEIDAEVVERYLTKHPSGLYVLPTGRRPEESEYVSPTDVRVILQAVRKRFDYVIVDTSPLANDVFFAIFESVDDRLMVSTLNLAVLKNNRMLLDLLGELSYERELVRHVLNRVNSKNGLKIKDVMRVLEADVFWELDNDYQLVETSINEGIPFVLKDHQHRLTKQIHGLIARMNEVQGIRVSRRNPLHKFLQRKNTR